MGATVHEMTLLELLIQPGATVAKGDKIAEFESDKSVLDYESPCDGVVTDIACRVGDILEVGGPFLTVETAEESLFHLKAGEKQDKRKSTKPSATKKTDVEKKPAPRRDPAPARPAALATTPSAAAEASSNGARWTPRALKIAMEAGVDPFGLQGVPATGPGGRVSGDDILAFLETHTPEGAHANGGGADGETVCVAGIGYAVPRNIRSNKEILKDFPKMTELEIVRITGIEQRYFADENESATSLSQIAVEKALRKSGLEIGDMDGIIMATILPDQPVPSAASALAKAIGLNKAMAFDLNAACSGWLYALEIGRAMILAGGARNLIVVTAELLSRITNPRDHATAFLFGDGAGAAILSSQEGGSRLHRMELSGDATHFDAIQRTGGGARMPMPRPGGDLDHFYLSMDGPVVFKQAVISFSNIIEATLRRHNLTVDDVSWIVPHQANERILKAVAKRVGIPFDRFVLTIGKYGNTSAASVSMALGWGAEEEIFAKGDRILFCSVGAGFTFAGGLLVW